MSSSLHIRFCGAQVRDRSSSSTRVVSSSSTNLVYCWRILSRSSMHCAKRAGRDEFSALLRLSNASSYYSTSSSIRGSRPHTPGPNTSTQHYTITDTSNVSWKVGEAELEQDGNTSTPEVVEGVTEAEDVEPPPRYEATLTPTVRRAMRRKTTTATIRHHLKVVETIDRPQKWW